MKKKMSNTKVTGHPFMVGEKYQNRDGEYLVVSIDDPDMVIRYLDNSIVETSIILQARIWENIQEHGSDDLGLKST